MAHHQTLQIINNFVLLAIGIAIFVTCYAGQPPCQQVTTPNTLDSNQSFYYLPFIMPTCSKEVKRRKKEEEAMAVAMLQKEKEAAKRLQQEEEAKAAAALAVSATEEVHQMVATEQAALPPVVSPPSAPTSTPFLLAMSAEMVRHPQKTAAWQSRIMRLKTLASPQRKKTKKFKSIKEGNASKRDCSGSALKKSSFTMSTLAVVTSAKEYKHKQVFYEAGMELKGEDKHGVYVKQIKNLLKNIQLVNITAIMHAAVESENSKPLGSKAEMNTNMTIFLAYAPVGNNANAFKPKRTITKQRDAKARMSWIHWILVYTPR
jgi:hypothetical protein